MKDDSSELYDEVKVNKGAEILYKKVKAKGIALNSICEVGVYLPEESNVIGFINDGINALLVEADPVYSEKSRLYFEGINNIEIKQVAVYDFDGEIELCRRESSTFIRELQSSPALVNDKWMIENSEFFIAKTLTFDKIDPGNLDLISIDIEGADWFVLKYMISRPKVISIETHGKYYTNPKLNEILEWMELNDYAIWYKGDSDTVFLKSGICRISLAEKIGIILKNISIRMIKMKRIFRKQR